ncbi:MAG: ABC transporter substrate-binding protein [Termitinemataceae bacterium]|nr:MAG: ABC transporter substrate-binding protein [Termitinemataceae bacterium]
MKKFFYCLCCILFFILSSCGKNTNKKIIDRVGQSIIVPTKIERIITAAPSNTEIIVALGLACKLVAVDRFSFDIEGIPDVPYIDFSAHDGEEIVNLNPDIIIASGTNQKGQANDPFRLIRETGITVVYVPMSSSIQGIYDDIAFIADLLDVPEMGNEIIDQTKETIHYYKMISEKITPKKRIYFEISPAPSVVSLGSQTHLNEMIEIIGGENIFAAEKGIVYPNAEIIITANPDVIITNVNYSGNQYVADPIAEIKTRDGFDIIDAVKNNQIFYVDTNSVSRPTHNIVKAVKIMAEVVYPEYYTTNNQTAEYNTR